MSTVTDSQIRFILRSPNQDTQVVVPKQWQSIELSLTRSEEYEGIFHEVVFDVLFYKNEGKEFLQTEFDTRGLNAEAFCEIEYKESGGAWESIFDGKFDFATYEIVPVGETYVKINIEANDFTSIVMKRDEVPVDLKSVITLDGSVMTAKTYNNYAIELHSQNIRFQSLLEEQVIPKNYQDTASFTTSVSEQIFIQHPHPMIVGELQTTTSQADIFEKGNGLNFTGTTLVTEFHTANDSRVQYPLTVTLNYNFRGEYYDKDATGQTRTLATDLRLIMRQGTTKATSTLVTNMGGLASGGYTTSSTSYSDIFNFSGSTSFTLDVGEKVWFQWQSTGGTGYVVTTGPGPTNVTFEFEYDIAKVEFIVDSTTDSSDGRGSAIFEAWSQVSESITDQTTGAFDSEYYGRKNSQPTSYSDNGCGSFRAVMSGKDIRGFQEPTTTTLRELFRACKAVDNVGLGIEQFGSVSKIKVEDISHFYDNSSVIFKATGMRDLLITVDLNRIYNRAKFGYQQWEVELTGGLDEFNSVREYEIDINHDNVLDQLCPYIAAGYAIEKTRRKNNLDFATEDTEFDENKFFIALSRSVDGGGNPDELDAPEQDNSLQTSSNVLDPASRYNFWLSPARNRLRWNQVLAASVYRSAGSEIKFRSGEGNTDMATELIDLGCDGDFKSTSLDEDASLAWDNANIRQNSPLWIPENGEFSDYPMKYSEYKLIKANPYKLIEYSNDIRRFGWILSLNFNLRLKKASFRLLRAFTE